MIVLTNIFVYLLLLIEEDSLLSIIIDKTYNSTQLQILIRKVFVKNYNA